MRKIARAFRVKRAVAPMAVVQDDGFLPTLLAISETAIKAPVLFFRIHL
jgi:hypothetical protein